MITPGIVDILLLPVPSPIVNWTQVSLACRELSDL